jgi:MSHA pilin protein MshA
MKQKGFTLIELVVVIVILGILAVTAAPRFLNLQSDARVSSLQGLKGAMASAGSIVYAKAAIQGDESASSALVSDSSVGNITIAYGYPTADDDGIGKSVDGLGTDWTTVTAVSAALPNVTAYTFIGNTATECQVQFVEATQTASPIITVFGGDC